MTERRSRTGRLLAALFIRGAEAPFILRDLDDSFNHDVARGLAPAEVRRRDLRNILASAGSVWAESLRPSAWRPSLLDVRLGLRTIVRTPWLSFVAVGALAIGIPVGLAPMHAVDALERPLPGDPDGRIRTLCYWRDTVHEHATAGDYSLWRTSLRSFGALAAYRLTTVNLDMGGAGLSVPGIETTASTFDILRTPAKLGRVLRADDERSGAPSVVVIGHDLWRAQFGGDPDIVGRPLLVGGAPFSVVGVMPPTFRFPTSHQLWMPLRMPDDGGGPRSGATLVVFGRLSDGVTPDSAQAETSGADEFAGSRGPRLVRSASRRSPSYLAPDLRFPLGGRAACAAGVLPRTGVDAGAPLHGLRQRRAPDPRADLNSCVGVRRADSTGGEPRTHPHAGLC